MMFSTTQKAPFLIINTLSVLRSQLAFSVHSVSKIVPSILSQNINMRSSHAWSLDAIMLHADS